MKTKKETNTTIVRNKYTAQFKEQALERADRDGVPTVAKGLGLAESILYNWRAKRRQTGRPFEDQKLQQAELARLKRENARLEEEVAFLKKAAAYFAKLPKSTAGMQEVGQRRSSCREVRHDQIQRKPIPYWLDVAPVVGIAQRLLRVETQAAFNQGAVEPVTCG